MHRNVNNNNDDGYKVCLYEHDLLLMTITKLKL